MINLYTCILKQNKTKIQTKTTKTNNKQKKNTIIIKVKTQLKFTDIVKICRHV